MVDLLSANATSRVRRVWQPVLCAFVIVSSGGCPCDQPAAETPPPVTEPPPSVDFEPPSDPPPSPGDTRATQLSLSRTHACVRSADDSVRCWGDDGWHELGPDDGEGSPVNRLPVDGVVQVAAGYGFTCLRLRDGSVKCLGANLHRTVTAPPSEAVSEPTTVGGLTDVVDLTAGQNHACALRRDGTVRCWGENRYGLLGTGGNEDNLGPTEVPRLDSVEQIEAGGATRALRGDGSIWCWGTNLTETPARLEVSGVVQVAMGSLGGGCVRTDDGGVHCWGHNESGQLGGEASEHDFTPRRLPLVENATDVAVGESFACAVREGRVACWGAGWGVGELPDDCNFQTTNSSAGGAAAQWHYCPRPIERDLEGVIDVEASGHHACAILEDGRVFCWGEWIDAEAPEGYIELVPSGEEQAAPETEEAL